MSRRRFLIFCASVLMLRKTMILPNRTEIENVGKYFTTHFSTYKSSMKRSSFLKIGFPGLYFFICVFSIQLTVDEICQWLDSNRGSVVLEATALPTELTTTVQWRKAFALARETKIEMHKSINTAIIGKVYFVNHLQIDQQQSSF